MIDQAHIVEQEVTKTAVDSSPWYRRVSWGAIFGGVVVAMLVAFAMEMLGVAIGVGALEPGEDTLGPEFSTAVVAWLAGSTLLALFAGGLVTGKLSGTDDGLDGVLQAVVMMGVYTFISIFLFALAVSATVRGVTNTISDGLSFVGASAEEVSTSVARSVELRDDTVETIRTELNSLLAEDASITSLWIAVDDYLLEDEPGDDLRQATISALASQTTLTEAEAANQLDEWERDFDQVVTRVEAEAEEVAEEVADIVAATAGVIFMILVAGAFAAASGGFVAVSAQSTGIETRRMITRRRAAEVVT